MRFPTMWYVRPAKAQIKSLSFCLSILSVKLLTEQCLELLRLKECCPGLSEATLVKMPHYGSLDRVLWLLFSNV